MAFLFWLEFLSGVPDEDRVRYEAALFDDPRGDDEHGKKCHLRISEIGLRSVLGGGDAKNLSLDRYERDKAEFGLFVLPH